MDEKPQNFDAVKKRLDEIVEEVSAEGVSLDEALALYEEAIKLGLDACNVSEADLLGEESPEDAKPQEEPSQEAPSQ